MTTKKKMGFEEQLHRIEDIVDILDEGEKPLDELIKDFEEGMKLTKKCREFLDKAEQKVIDISKMDSGD